MIRNKTSLALAISAATVMLPDIAMAQSDSSGESSWASTNTIQEIMVTARKREESQLEVPVTMTTIGAGELERRSITNLDNLARVVPGLVIGNQGGSVQGGNISLRGISGPDSNPFGEEAVSFNIDGVQVAKGAVRRMSDIDMEQVEVLKGPQALFFGKNSPAGIVSIRTANPTDHFEAKISVGYEDEAEEKRTEGYISGPLTDTIGIRFAAGYSDMDGDMDEVTPAINPFTGGPNALLPGDDTNVVSEDYATRLTVTFDPNDVFNARLKLNYGEVETNGPQAGGQFVSCFFGFRQTGSGGPCGAGDQNINASNGPVVGTIPGTLNHYGDGQNFQEQEQFLGGLEMNYDLTSNLRLTSVTGYYDMDLDQCQNYESDWAIALPSCNVLKNKELSQELRLVSNFDGALNFAAGAYAADTEAETGSLTWLFGNGFDLLGPGLGGLDTPLMVNNYFLEHEGSAWSVFFQGIWNVTDKLELTAGGRYSYEKKEVVKVLDEPGLTQGALVTPDMLIERTILDEDSIVNIDKNDDNWYDFSPEVTFSYMVTDFINIFGSYKEGFLSGGFNGSSVTFSQNPDIGYDPQFIDGYELGIKTQLLDGSLDFTASIYTYDVEDLQVTNFTNATAFIRNAGEVEIEGGEFDLNWRTPVEGLMVYLAAAYNDGTYSQFNEAPCYNGQTPALGCTIPAGSIDPIQDLSGTELVRAPDWNITSGINYEMPLGDSLMLGLSADISHSSSYLTDLSSDPASRSPSYNLIDASIRIGDINDRWTVTLQGKNLNDERYWLASPNVPFTGINTGTVDGVQGDRFAVVSRGREVWLKLSYRFGG